MATIPNLRLNCDIYLPKIITLSKSSSEGASQKKTNDAFFCDLNISPPNKRTPKRKFLKNKKFLCKKRLEFVLHG